jgi:hypothetical protein
MQMLLDGVGEVNPTEGGRRREDSNITGPEGVHGFLVGVEANEPSGFRNVQLLGVRFLQVLVACFDPLGEDVRHRDQFRRPLPGGQGIGGSAGAATPRTDQSDPDGFVSVGMNQGDADPGQSRSHGNAAAGLDQLTPRGQIGGVFVHR